MKAWIKRYLGLRLIVGWATSRCGRQWSLYFGKRLLSEITTGDLRRVRWERGAVSKCRKVLVPPTRIERATNGLGNRCSIQLSYGGVRLR